MSIEFWVSVMIIIVVFGLFSGAVIVLATRLVNRKKLTDSETHDRL